MLQVGTKVKIKSPVLAGEVKSMRVSDDGSMLMYLVSYEDADGEQTERYCVEEILEVTG